MKNLFYARINGELKESGLAVRLRVRRVPALAGFAGMLAALWWLGSLSPEAMVGLVVFGAVWGGDKGPGSDEPASPWQNRTLLSLLDGLFMSNRPRRRRGSSVFRGSDEPMPPVWWKMLEELKRALEPEPEGLPPFQVSSLPPLELETERWPTRATRPMETERALKALEREISRRFQEEVRKQRPTLQLEMRAPRRPAREPTFTERLEQLARQPEPREPTFSERLEQLARQPEPREPTFSERLEQLAREDAEGAPDFRTGGERRRDARQKAARRRPSKKEPSAVERLLAQVDAERRRKAAQFPETDPQTAEELSEAGPISRKKLRKRLTPRQILKEEVYRRLGDYWKDMVKHPPKSVGEAGKLFEKHFKDLGIEGKLEGSKLVYRDKQGEMVAEFHGEIASGIHSFDKDGNVSMVIPPQAGLGVVGRIFPPSRERATLIVGSRIWGVGEIIPQDPLEDLGIYIAVGRYRSPIPVPVTISFPAEPDETLLELQRLLGGLM